MREVDVTKAAKAAYRAFYSKGVRNYFNGGGRPVANERAYEKYQKALSVFKKAYDKAAGSKPAFDDYFQAMQEVANGTIAFEKKKQ